jgi:AGCS family alanine or glycine:cation symporter
MPYRIVFIFVVFIGSVTSLNIVWDFSDLTNGLMAIPNLVSLLLLSGVIASETKKYLLDDNIDEISTDEVISIKK